MMLYGEVQTTRNKLPGERRARRSLKMDASRRTIQQGPMTSGSVTCGPLGTALDRIHPPHASVDRRGARSYEQLRLRTERHAVLNGKTPRVLLAEVGDVKMRSARSSFAQNFFASAGFELVTRRFESAGKIPRWATRTYIVLSQFRRRDAWACCRTDSDAEDAGLSCACDCRRESCVGEPIACDGVSPILFMFAATRLSC